MNSRIRILTLAAAGALAMAWTAPVLAAKECVTIAHDVASGEKLNLDPARNVVWTERASSSPSTTRWWTSTATFSSSPGSPRRGSPTKMRRSGPSSCARG